MSKSLNQIRDEALDTATKNGFKDASFVEDLALIHSEVSEALEDFRAGYKPDVHYYENKHDGVYEQLTGELERFRKKSKPVGIPSELADIIIRVAHLAGKHGIDLERAVEEKLAYNRTRPYKHGKVI